MSAQRSVVARGGASVAVVGRPNVGKSTLVNRLSGRREAIVEEKPGVTRDRTTHEASWQGRRFTVVDTGGWTPGWARVDEHGLDAAVAAQAEAATRLADLVLLVLDGAAGVTEEDAAAAKWVRQSGAEVLLVANKVDKPSGLPPGELTGLYALGLGEPLQLSALHGHGSGDLLDVVVRRLAASGALDRPAAAPGAPGVALLGRPNVGKSSLFNRLIGEERVIVDDRPGTTRDAVDTVVEAGGRQWRFVDTAGLRKRSRSGGATEYYSTVRTVQALDRAAVALLVIDASEPVTEQDQRLARQVLDAGRALVLVLNKWDLVDEERRELLDRERDRMLGFVDFAELVRTSALTGRALDRLLPRIESAHEQWTHRVPTARLNSWLGEAVAATAPPMFRGRPVRLRYATQPRAEPPTFRIFGTGEVPSSYVRYLERRLRESFGFQGTPLDVAVRVRARWEDRKTG